MPVSAAQLDSLKRFITEGDIYAGVTKPADLADMGITQSTGVPTGGVSVGLTQGAASLEYKPSFKAIEVEQTFGEIAPRLEKEEVMLKFKCAEATYDRLKLAYQTSTLTTTAGVTTTPGVQKLTVGGKTTATTQCIALVSSIGSYVSGATTVKLWEWVCIYEAMSVEGVKLDYKRSENRMVEVTVRGYADVTRTVGDQLFQHVQQTAVP